MRKVLLHTVFWLLFFLMWDRVMYFYVSNPANQLYFTALDVSLFIIAFYVVYLALMPWYLRRKNLGLLIAFLLGLTLLLGGMYSLLMLIFLRHALMPIRFEFSWNYTDMQYNRLLIALVGVLSGCLIKLAMDRLVVEKRLEQTERQRSAAELTYLKAQINPHFLFNALNTLYAQLDLQTGDAKGTLATLAGLLRYQLYECEAEYIPVGKELAYLENYFSLQSIRNDNCMAEFKVTKPAGDLLIAPLLLVPFVENAFKYVSYWDDEHNFIKASVRFEGEKLLFECANTVDQRVKTHTAGGIGLVNVKKRLELLYGNKYRLQNGAKDDLYHVNLTIDLKNA